MTPTAPARQPWPMKALGAMTAAEILAALERLACVRPEDAALERALHRQLVRAVERERAGARGAAAPA
ncbi:hypothetical protein ACFPZ0_26695 [Streptomonospora nanhaiensis]|uniref:Uncharacterized protein n=1 Tax=Streptomonospora nanhaiensis TaxID=1323731 RepID=A0A853BNI7_9ACTN|nr:hypothetical protein [Streptomonospora nanhaiensis]MBV2364305.1 hypothetical protein [Streptomonospora nanhaiensis]MBX9391549.1 hypothetical protein [Streptomonospora nanhaiensis]NYI97189.1 hypothetical protein [Streptomonospora nanhaiensis]